MASVKSRLGRYNRSHVYLLANSSMGSFGVLPLSTHDSLKKAQEFEKDDEGNRRTWEQSGKHMLHWESKEYPERTIFEVPFEPEAQ